MIHCIGDSHVSVFSGRDAVSPSWSEPARMSWDLLPDFRTYRIGPTLAYSMGDPEHTGRKILFGILKDIPKDSIILLIFGEIDCRSHLLKQRDKQGKPIEVIVKDCVNRYMDVVENVRTNGYRPAVFGGIPSGCKRTFGAHEDPWGYYGNPLERNETSKLFDAAVAEECTARSIPFVSIFDQLVNSELVTQERFFFDEIHLGAQALPLLIEKVKAIGLMSSTV